MFSNRNHQLGLRLATLKTCILSILFLDLCTSFHYHYAMDQKAIIQQGNTPDTLKHLCFGFFAQQHYKKNGILADFSQALDKHIEIIPKELKKNFEKWIKEKPFYPNAVYKACMTYSFDNHVECLLRQKNISSKELLQMIEIHVKHPSSESNREYLHYSGLLNHRDHRAYLVQNIEKSDTQKKLCGREAWENYKYIFIEAPEDLENVILSNNSDPKSREKIFNVLELEQTSSYKQIMDAALLYGINPIFTIQALAKHASHDSSNYKILEDILSLKSMQPWMNNLRRLPGETSLSQHPQTMQTVNC